jgi:hypothetical protein
MLSEIYEKTSQTTIKQHLFIIDFFQKILGHIITDNIETEFYNICYIYFKLSINYGNLDKTELNERLKKINVVDSFLKKITSSSEIDPKDLKLLKEVNKFLSPIKETSEETSQEILKQLTPQPKVISLPILPRSTRSSPQLHNRPQSPLIPLKHKIPYSMPIKEK